MNVPCLRCNGVLDPSGNILAMAAYVCETCIEAVTCWRCGDLVKGYFPYLLCEPCLDDVTPEEIALLDDDTYQPGKATWEMTPMVPRQ